MEEEKNSLLPLSEKALRARRLLHIIEVEDPTDFILSLTTTNRTMLNFTELVEEVLSNPNNLDWLITGGYFTESSAGMTIAQGGSIEKGLAIFKERLLICIHRYNEAVEEINTIVKGE